MRRARGLLSVMALVAATLAFATTPDASAAALPILHSGMTGTGQEAHQCTVIGNDGTTEGVVCIDILTGVYESNSGPGTYARNQTEIFCQNMTTNQTVRCADALVTFGLYNAAGGANSGTNECGPNYTQCSTGRNYYSNTTFDYPWSIWSDSNCATNISGQTSVWAVAFGSNSNTVIQLPGSGKYVSLTSGNDGSNESSGHYFICP
jgi:hypothetical protein